MKYSKEERQRIIDEVKKKLPFIKEEEIFVKDDVYGEVLSCQVRWNLDPMILSIQSVQSP